VWKDGAAFDGCRFVLLDRQIVDRGRRVIVLCGVLWVHFYLLLTNLKIVWVASPLTDLFYQKSIYAYLFRRESAAKTIMGERIIFRRWLRQG
jgi:hypothetical protein